MKYSQNNEEEIINRYFGERVGRFLDIGAADGQWLSNTRQLALNGWAGVLVEPAPALFPKLVNTYSGNQDFVCINAAVSGKAGLRKMYYEKDRDFANSLNVEISEHNVFHPVGHYYVSTISPDDLIPFGPFDFISIDAEWEDWNILLAAEALVKPCRCLCVEIPYQKEDDARFVRLLSEYGFTVLHKTLENLIVHRI